MFSACIAKAQHAKDSLTKYTALAQKYTALVNEAQAKGNWTLAKKYLDSAEHFRKPLDYLNHQQYLEAKKN